MIESIAELKVWIDDRILVYQENIENLPELEVYEYTRRELLTRISELKHLRDIL